MSVYKTTPIIVIPAFTKGCKLPDHFLRDFCGKPLLQRTFDAAVQAGFLIGINIKWLYLVTDNQDIANKYSDYITTIVIDEDDKGTPEKAVRLAMEMAEIDNHDYDCVMLLDANYPLRSAFKLSEMVKKYDPEYDLVVTVSRSAHSPYTDMFQKSRKGMLARCKKASENGSLPTIWVANPIATLLNPESLRKSSIDQFQEVLPIYDEEYLDFNLDTELGWEIAELIARRTNPFIERKPDTTYDWPI